MTDAMSPSVATRYSAFEVGWVKGDIMAAISPGVTIIVIRSGFGGLGTLGTSIGRPLATSNSDIWPLCTSWAAMRAP